MVYLISKERRENALITGTQGSTKSKEFISENAHKNFGDVGHVFPYLFHFYIFGCRFDRHNNLFYTNLRRRKCRNRHFSELNRVIQSSSKITSEVKQNIN